ncbi:MAG: hypothetical protein JAZ11_06960 [Candidatus Thiodiazotropha lotti]|nr:hypothetical protein [Candidatus Thiodiazotropha lotti]
MDEATLSTWITYYYKNPEPELVSSAIQSLQSTGYFNNDSSAAPMSTFLGTIFSNNKNKIKEWAAIFKPYNDKEKLILIYALWYSNTDISNKQLKSLKNSDIHAELIEKLLASPPKGVETMQITGPAVLDMLWGAFQATGDTKYIDRIITVLPYVNVKGDTARLLTGGAAQWSLTSNAVQHDIVYDHCNMVLDKQPDEIKQELTEILESAKKQRANKRITSSSTRPFIRRFASLHSV